MSFSISEYDEYQDRDEAIKFVESHDYDLTILEWDMSIVVKNDHGLIIGVGNYQIAPCRVEAVTDIEDVAFAICKHFGQNKIVEVDCSNPEIQKRINYVIEHPFATRA